MCECVSSCALHASLLHRVQCARVCVYVYVCVCVIERRGCMCVVCATCACMYVVYVCERVSMFVCVRVCVWGGGWVGVCVWCERTCVNVCG